ncbi:MAG: peptide chain release factor N(5)-glutamine methyltransferase [Anaerolineae bacterium]
MSPKTDSQPTTRRGPPAPTVGVLLAQLTTRFRDAGCDTPSLDAQVIVARALGVNRAWLLAHPEAVVPADVSATIERWAQRREEREPLAYVIGRREFYGLDFIVDGSVLTPRPETEMLVERALDVIWAWREAHGVWPRVADLGAGSGAIAVTIAAALPDLEHVTAVDISPHALAVAELNAAHYGVGHHIDFRRGDLLLPLDEPVDVILANLPYIPTGDLATLQPEVQREPRLALDGGPDGLDLFRRLFAQALGRVSPQAVFLLEVGAGQGAAVAELARTLGQVVVTVTPDLAGHDRLVEIKLAHA